MSMAALISASDRLAACAAAFEGANAAHIALRDALQAEFSTRQASLAVTVHVNQAVGSDTAAGSAQAPLRSLDAALARTPFGGVCTVILLADYEVPYAAGFPYSTRIDGRRLVITAPPGPLRALTFNRGPLGGATRQLAPFSLENGGSLVLRGIKTVIPDATGYPAAIGSDCQIVAISRHDRAYSGICELTLRGGELALPTNHFAALLEAGSPCALTVEGVTVTGAPLAGRVMWAVAAGATTPRHVLSTLVTL